VADGPARHLLIVPHTHWDREWYRSHEQFRYRLVRLLDDLLDLLDRDPDFRRFTLDGQMVPLDDYLEVRPEARERIAKRVREGRLVIGPWYVLPDEWLVSGEALIRNLRLGLARAAELGGGMRLGYVPDQFGHVGQLPQIFASFGFEAAILWRGVGAEVDQTCFHWEAPDGTRLFAVYLPQGYGNASELPLDPQALALRLHQARASLEPFSRIPTLLLMNGSDHAIPRPGLPAALAAAAGRLEGMSWEIGALPDFVERARAEAPAELPLHRGELRSGLRAPLLEGCASARIHLKQADFQNDRLLVRWLEPLAAWLAVLGGDPDPAILELCWKVALENHPHDSICGCSIDRVHAEMETRFARVGDLATEHLRHVTRELAARVSCPVAAPDLAGIAVWNPNAGGVAQARGRLQLDVPDGRVPALHLLDASGTAVPLHAEIVEPGRVVSRYLLPARVVAILVRGFPGEFSGEFATAVACRRRGGRLEVEIQLGREPDPGFDLTAAKEEVVRRLEAEGDAEAEFRARRLPLLELRFVDRLPGHGLRTYRVRRGGVRSGDSELRSGRTADGGAWIENAAWRVEAARDGTLRCIDRRSGARIEDALRLVSEGDRGDEYNFDPVPGAARVERPERVRVRLVSCSPAEVGLRIDARYRVPAALAPDRRERAARRVELPARLEIRLSRALDRVDARIEVDNRARDHRLRLHVRAPFRATRFEVESAFEVAGRPIEPRADASGPPPAEQPIGATPQRSFASLSAADAALTVANRGVPEAEAVHEVDGGSALALTVLRAVGWLSRDDLVLRPGHAGPGLETPGAQVPGPRCAELSFRLHAVGDARRTAEAHAFAWPALLFAGAGAEDAPLRDGARLVELDDPEVVVSALEPRAEGEPILRLYNASRQPRRVRVRWNGPRARRLEGVDPSGRPVAVPGLVPGAGACADLALRGAQIVSLRPR
jgi:hypothetical protein